MMNSSIEETSYSSLFSNKLMEQYSDVFVRHNTREFQPKAGAPAAQRTKSGRSEQRFSALFFMINSAGPICSGFLLEKLLPKSKSNAGVQF
jgi:hypothetical protein